MKTALIMEGGAMRGMFTCGVIDVLMENHIEFDGAAGISAGAVFGCNFKSRQIGRPVRYNKKYCADPRYCSARSLLATGDLYGADFCYRELPDILDPFDRKAFEENPMEFYAGATDVATGRCEYRLCMDGGEEDMQWFRASASMPVVSRPVEIGGKQYLDGGISDAVPYRFMEKKGYSHNVIVLTQPRGYRKEPQVGLMLRLLLQKTPKILEAMEHRHEMYNRQMDELDKMEDEKTALVIRPPEDLAIGHTEKNPEELERVYQIGRREAEKRMEDINNWLKPDKEQVITQLEKVIEIFRELEKYEDPPLFVTKYEEQIESIRNDSPARDCIAGGARHYLLDTTYPRGDDCAIPNELSKAEDLVALYIRNRKQTKQ